MQGRVSSPNMPMVSSRPGIYSSNRIPLLHFSAAYTAGNSLASDFTIVSPTVLPSPLGFTIKG